LRTLRKKSKLGEIGINRLDWMRLDEKPEWWNTVDKRDGPGDITIPMIPKL